MNVTVANLTLNFGWQAALFEGSSMWVDKAKQYYSSVLALAQRHRVSIYEAMMMPDNVNEKMQLANVPAELDILSIDIDSF